MIAAAVLAFAPVEVAGQRCNTGCEIITYPSSITSDANGPLDLKAFVFYPRTLAPGAAAPIAVAMHGYSGAETFSGMRVHGERLAKLGFVSIVVAMRGRDGSDGVRDSGGLEIHDIVDAVEHVKQAPFYAPRVNPANVHITGYSGGGGNVMSALTKFPDYFNLGASHFGMSDYGYDPVTGWYVNGANVGGTRTPQLDIDVGNPVAARLPGGNPLVLDRYMARASNLASHNNPYSEIHLFVNDDEVICPPVNSLSYKANAASNASFAGEFENITVHVGKSNNTLFIDRNDDGTAQSSELQNFPHSDGVSSAIRGEEFYVQRLLAKQVPQPVLNSADRLFVAGFVKTRPFDLFLGDGQNAAGVLDYALTPGELRFGLRIESLDKQKTGRLTIDTSRLAGAEFDVLLNDQRIGGGTVGGRWSYQGLANGDVLRLVAVPEPSAAAIAASALGVVRPRKRAPEVRRPIDPPSAKSAAGPATPLAR